MRVAVVEDEPKLAGTLREGLEAEGYTVTTFGDGQSAYDGLVASPFDLVLLDLMLPHKSGAEVCQALRAAGVMVPVVVLTARDMAEDKVRLLDFGADDYVVKPFSFDELLARMRALTRRVGGVSYRAADVVLDPSTYKVTRAGREIPLTFKEFELLRYLLEQRGKAASREAIYQALWGRAEDDFGNVVDVHIRNLRKKLDDPYDAKIIRTVRGVGYAVEG